MADTKVDNRAIAIYARQSVDKRIVYLVKLRLIGARVVYSLMKNSTE